MKNKWNHKSLLIALTLVVSSASYSSGAFAAETQPAPAPAPAPQPAPQVWVEGRIHLAASLVDVASKTSRPAFEIAGSGRVLKDGFKSELTFGEKTIKCDYTGQLSDSKTHITQYYCFLGEEAALDVIQTQAQPSEETDAAIQVLQSYFEQDDLRSLLILVAADSEKPLYTQQVNQYLEPKQKQLRVDIQSSTARP